jgi:FKBP-type peptidyl-prolyl cis-trans isomerase
MHRRVATLAFLVVAAIGAGSCQKQGQESAKAPEPAIPTSPELATDEQKTIYALGLALARNLEPFHLSAAEIEILAQGLADGALGRTPKVPLEQYAQNLQELAKTRAAAAAAEESKAAAPFLDAAAAEPGAVKSDSGLIYQETKAGTGASPQATDTVKVHYHGTLRDGTVFDSSRDRGQPAQFPLNRVIPCWTEAVQKMKVGGTATIWCPASIAYGDRGAPPRIKPGAALKFEIELIDIVPAAAQELPPGHPQIGGEAAKPAPAAKPTPAAKKK